MALVLVDQVKAVIIEPMVLLDITYVWSLVMTCGFYAKSIIPPHPALLSQPRAGPFFPCNI